MIVVSKEIEGDALGLIAKCAVAPPLRRSEDGHALSSLCCGYHFIEMTRSAKAGYDH